MILRFTPEAIRDIAAFCDYVAGSLNNPTAATRIKTSLLHTCSLLKEQPYMGGAVQENTGQKTDLRYFVCEKQFIFYSVEKDTVSVARVISARQDAVRVLFQEDEATGLENSQK